MSFTAIIGTLIGEILVLLLGSAAFLLLIREYRERRQRHLLFFGLAELSFALAFGLLFVSQALTYYELPIQDALPLSYRIAFSLFLIALILGLFEAYAGKSRVMRWSVAVLAALILFWSSLVGSCSSTLLNGVSFCDGSILRSWLLGACLIVFLMMVFLSGRARSRLTKQSLLGRPDTLMMWSGFCGLLALYTIITAAILQDTTVILLAFLPVYAHLALLFIGAVAKDNPNRSIVERPANYVRRSLTFKASLLIVVMFWLLGLTMTAVTTIFFMRALQVSSESRIGRDAGMLADDLSERQELLLQEAALVGTGDFSFAELAAGFGGDAVVELEQNYKLRGSRVSLRVVDEAGRVLFSNRTPDESGRTLAAAGDLIGRALSGYRAVGLEHDQLLNRAVLRAAVPLAFTEGSRGALVLSTEYAPGRLLDSDDSGHSAYGLLAADGESVLSAGRNLGIDENQMVRRVAGREAVSLVRMTDGSLLGSKRIFDNEGLPRGSVYVLLTAAAIGAAFMRTISLIILMNLLALLVMTLVVVMGIRSLLQPIRALRHAARAMASEDQAKPIVYESLDEVGEMASSFNKMSATIADRTSRLRRALREQLDALIHTANGIIMPLNVLRWTTDLLRFGDTGRLNKQQLELVEQMHQTNQRLYGLVQNFLQAAQLDQGQLTADKTEFPVEEAIDQAAGILAISARNRKIELHWERPKRPLPRVLGDRVHVINILLHLLGNAIKYTPEDGRITVAAATADRMSPDGQAGEFIEVAVSDTGRGIAPEEMNRVFGRFFRSAAVAHEDIEGTGLGLYIVRGLVELNGGRVWVNSEAGSGSTFRFTLPLAGTHRDK